MAQHAFVAQALCIWTSLPNEESLVITDRHLYEIQERVDSAIARLHTIASASSFSKLVVGDAIAAEIREVISRDLHEVNEKLEYARQVV